MLACNRYACQSAGEKLHEKKLSVPPTLEVRTKKVYSLVEIFKSIKLKINRKTSL